MVLQVTPTTVNEVFYPDCDGQPLANNTEQFDWIVLIKENLDFLFVNHSNGLTAGDLFWYPVEGNPNIKVAPDVLVALERPRGKRYSYKQWEEGGQAPQVVFEILSPANTVREMDQKLLFFDRYGVSEYYIYDPAKNELRVWLRDQYGLNWVEYEQEWVSPLLQVRMVVTDETLELYTPEGALFLSPMELSEQLKQERQYTEQERQRAEQERQRAEQERQRAEQERQHAEQEQQHRERLEAFVRSQGFDPDALPET